MARSPQRCWRSETLDASAFSLTKGAMALKLGCLLLPRSWKTRDSEVETTAPDVARRWSATLRSKSRCEETASAQTCGGRAGGRARVRRGPRRWSGRRGTRVDVDAHVQQVERRLEDADVGLEAADDGRGAAELGQVRLDVIRAHGEEGLLEGRGLAVARQEPADLADRVLERLRVPAGPRDARRRGGALAGRTRADALLRDDDGDLELPGGLDHEGAALDQGLEAHDHVPEPLLDVADEHRGRRRLRMPTESDLRELPARVRTRTL